MVTAIEDQIHQAFIAQEEKRCLEIEETTGKSVKRRDVPKPWRRMNQQALLQDVELLQHVREIDYDLNDPAFLDYCRERGVLYLAGEPGGHGWQYFCEPSKTKDQFLCDPKLRHAKQHEGKRHEFSEEEMEIQWRILCFGRAKLQDCWEIYRSKYR